MPCIRDPHPVCMAFFLCALSIRALFAPFVPVAAVHGRAKNPLPRDRSNRPSSPLSPIPPPVATTQPKKPKNVWRRVKNPLPLQRKIKETLPDATKQQTTILTI